MMQARSLRRRGGWAALFALAVQLVLSFGHMHPLPTTSAPVLTAAVGGGPLQSGGGDPGDAASDICAICVSIHLASTTALPPPVPLVVPVATYLVVAYSRGHVVEPRLPPLPFRTRAPPTA